MIIELVNEDDKREIPKLKSKENFEEKCLDNINEFFK